MSKLMWNSKDINRLYELRHQDNLTFKEIGNKLGRSAGSVEKRYRRTNWDEFLKDPESYVNTQNSCNVGSKWKNTEMAQLDAYLLSGKSYEFIAEQMDRSIIAIERKAQTTDWKAWRSIDYAIEEAKDGSLEEERQAFLKQLIGALLTICRYNITKLKTIKESKFLKQVNLEKEKMGINFSDLKKQAFDELNNLGFGNPDNIQLGEGTYVIVGDSHGKHTSKPMFSLLKQINKHLKPDAFIHIGHLLDDDNDISYEWGSFKNLIVLSKIEELKFIQAQRNKFNFNYEIIKEHISLGDDLIVWNQDIINDYVKSPIRNLDVEIFDQKVIVNCHRHEFFTRCSYEDASYFASPGCICERHIIKTIKQIDFTDGRIVKQAFWEGFSKYRKWTHMNKYWENGILVVHVDDEGNHTIIPCCIKKLSNNNFATSYFDKIITSKGVRKPDNKIFINGDLHCSSQDNNILDIQEGICKDYKPDMYVNIGDTMNFSALNHHIMDRGGVIVDKFLLDESAETYSIIKRLSGWAKKSYLIYGNHERFGKDFIEKYPQLGEYLDFKFLCDVENLGYTLVPLKNVLSLGSSKFIHGEIRMYGQKGNKLEKALHTFGRDIFIGHIHSPMIRFGAYSIGLTGQLDQKYNEPDASQWLHGLGMCNQYKNKSWPTTIAIVNNKCILNRKKYLPTNPDSWKIKNYKVELKYEIEQ